MIAMSLASLAMLALLGCGDSSTGDGKGKGSAEHGPQGPPLYATVAVALPKQGAARIHGPIEEVVVDSCRVIVINKQDVPSLRDGVVKEIQVHEGDYVKKGQVLVQLDDRLPSADVQIKMAKVEAAKADCIASEKTRDESYQRWQTQIRLRARNATSDEDVRAADLTYVRYGQEAVSKKAAIDLAKEELNQAEVVLGMHKLESAADGRVKTIYRKNGESVKNLEPVLQIDNVDKLRVEAMVDRQNAALLRPGMTVWIEPNRPAPPMQTLHAHLQEVTAVAVSGSNPPLIVSASEDGSLRIWERGADHRWKPRQVLKNESAEHTPMAVRSVACTPKGVKANLCLAGGADGKARLWDLNAHSDQPVRVLDKDPHRGAITCVAFAPDGQTCATGGEDREIRVWNVETGELRYRFPAGHRGAVTWIQYTPDSRLVSAGRDNRVLYWGLHDKGAELLQQFPNRSGDVAHLSVSPDGKRVLFDQGKSLQVLTLDKGNTDGVLQSGSASNFTTFAQFSPDGRLILTASGGLESRMQLWDAPTDGDRGHELLQLSARHKEPPTCCAFAPDGSFLVTGSKDRQVIVWPVPSADEWEKDGQITGKISFIDRGLESASKQVRVWVDFSNPKDRIGQPLLVPGDTATIAIDPSQK
jgi:WD40 repeat protein